MNIAIVGTGYVGLVSGACFAETGATVTCVDVNPDKINKLLNGVIPIYEPGLDELVKKNIKAGRLKFSTSLADVLNDQEVVFTAVGTPPDEDGSADLKYVLQVAKTIGENLDRYIVVVTKSTVPVGTARKVFSTIKAELDKRGKGIEFDVASNPEFLKEGNAIKDFMSPDRVVIGVESERAKKLLTKLYKPFLINNFRVIFMDIPSAEMTKYAANSMLATRISFMNDIANLCELVGADVNSVRAGIGSDTRIGRKFLYAGCGYGGSCFPKDVKALVKTGEKNNVDMNVIKAAEKTNEIQKHILYKKLYNAVAKVDYPIKTITILGTAFKANTDDMREATSIVFVNDLLNDDKKLGPFDKIKIYDPIALNEAKRRIGEYNEKIEYCEELDKAIIDSDAIVIVTDWKQIKDMSLDVVKRLMNGNIIVDGRNVFDRNKVESLDFIYEAIGK